MTDSRYHGLTDTLFIPNVTILLFFLSLQRTPSSILEYLPTSQVYFSAQFLRLFLSFLIDFRFFCPSIKIPSSFVAAMNKFVQSVKIFPSAVNLINNWKFQSQARSSIDPFFTSLIDPFSTDFCGYLVVSPF